MELMTLHASDLVRDEDGVTAIEYALIALLIAIVIIGAVSSVGTNLQGIFNFIAGQLVI